MRCAKVSMMIRITLKGNPDPLKGGNDHETVSDVQGNLREDSLAARRDRWASGPLAGRCDANAPATLLLATAVVCVNRALGGPQGWRFPPRSPGVHNAHTSACFDCEKSQVGSPTLHFLHPPGLEVRSTSTLPRTRKQKVWWC